MDPNNSNGISTFYPFDPVKEVHNLLGVRKLLESARKLGMTKRSLNPILMSVCPKLLAFAQELPASCYTHHAAPGGLAAHGLDVGALTLAKLNSSGLLPRNAVDELKQREAYAWQAFSFALGALHDVPRVGRAMHVIEESSCKKPARFDLKKDRCLHDWMRKKRIRSYNIEMTKFFPLSADIKAAAPLALELLQQQGFLNHPQVRHEISDPKSDIREAITEFVNDADMASVEENRAVFPETKRSSTELRIALIECSLLGFRPLPKPELTGDPGEILHLYAAMIRSDPPMVDGLYDIYEWAVDAQRFE